ncbi:globin-coupled sensor protein [Methylocapsa acidiphila]|uniref:globin-coupled sensor protein n=1 Tax=Methylocapsa acidiphila TaxID=133552 RepID=UPI000400474E|nr:globin-coupled sensor protein [Methylocapsa acidiphila]
MSAQDPLQQRLDFLNFDEKTKASMRDLKPLIAAAIGPALGAFYAKVREAPDTRRFFRDDSHMASAKSRQEQHWEIIAAADYGETYVRAVKAIGQTHARLGLEPRWYVGGYALVTESLIHALVKDQWPGLLQRTRSGPEGMAHSLSALMKAVMLDMDYAISSYLEALDEERRRAEAARQEAERRTEEAMAATAKALARLAAGDLASRIDADLAAEFQQLKLDFNAAVGRLREAIAAVAKSSQGLKSGAEEIAQASDDLSRRTEKQAANLEQTAAAMEQLTASVKQTAAGALDAAKVVATMKSDAQDSGDVVRQAVAAMSEIETSSKQISKIIGVIDEIAFQTNLLALNAGVEAARAGDAGRGFAVVAQEVRALAQRSAEAAKEIKALIAASSAEVGVGVNLVRQTGASLQRIIDRVAGVDRLVGEIAASAKEQAGSLNEVNIAVNQMDQLTQQNAAMVEQATAATYSLKGETDELARLVAKFRIDEQETTKTTAGPPPLAAQREKIAAFARQGR